MTENVTQKKNVKDLFDATAFDSNGEKLGGVKEIFLDDNTGQPTFVETNHGLFGLGSSLVPLRGHRLEGDKLQLAFGKDSIKDAPSIDAEKGLTPEEQNKLYEHYGLSGTKDTESYNEDKGQSGKGQSGQDASGNTGAAAGAGLGAGAAAGAGVGAAAGNNAGHTGHGTESATTNTSGAAGTDEARHATENRAAGTTDDGSVVRSEEQLKVDKDRVETGHARLRKYVVTDTETVEVPVSREEVRVTREPISAEEAAKSTGKIGEDEASVTLHEDRVSVNKETVPVEKVSLDKTEVQDTERVSEQVRKEQVETEGINDSTKK